MDKLAIVNKALLKSGLAPAAALEDCNWNAGYVFEMCAEEVFRSFTWNFARKTVVLERANGSPVGYRYAYALPSDYCRRVSVHAASDLRSPEARCDVSGRILFANVSPCYLCYVAKFMNPQDWPPDFADAVATRIAQEIAPLSAQSMALIPQLVQQYQLSLSIAQASDAREKTGYVPFDNSFVAARSQSQTQN